jgi:hypothetical protein
MHSLLGPRKLNKDYVDRERTQIINIWRRKVPALLEAGLGTSWEGGGMDLDVDLQL